jgi:hypothetical protein
MTFTAVGPRIFPVTADWSDAITETLSWGTDYMQASATGVTVHRSYRQDPRRSFAFQIKTQGQERRVIDILLAGHSGKLLMPIWPDVHWLTSALSAGVDQIPCITTGTDLHAGGQALLWHAVNRWEVVDIASVGTDHIALSAGTTAEWAVGDRLYPLRSARVQDSAEESLWHDDAGLRTLTFDIVERSDWPALDDLPTYLDHPLLNTWPDWSDEPTSSYARLRTEIDNDSGIPLSFDVAGVAFRSQSTSWKLFGRDERTWFRSLAYTLCGRQAPIWLPSYTSDLLVTGDISAADTELTIEWAGYSLFGAQTPGRRDLRIELYDGTAYHRRITGSLDAGDSELITIDSALGESVGIEQIRAVQIMSLATLASDDIEIEHITDIDGVATSTLTFASVVPDV